MAIWLGLMNDSHFISKCKSSVQYSLEFRTKYFFLSFICVTAMFLA